ncbi:MAG: hypothetical protein IT379_34675 [Deltaproteobacteria bacterium]|nr:hypothetical protein [Deltaproteobacteria bacterium]
MDDQRTAAFSAVLDGDEVDGVLRGAFFQPAAAAGPPSGTRRRRAPRPVERPEHYDVICISLYREDLERLDAKVRALKERGHRKMSRSALIRFALDSVDLEALPKGY